jgi:hypothetical protein
MKSVVLVRLFLGSLGLALFVSGCTQLPLELPSPTHTSQRPTDRYAGLLNFGKVTDHIWRGAQPTDVPHLREVIKQVE